ncbi:MAG: lytic transglycosylase domain-containing protein, partial [Candidatus Eremiobacteraeota bacterium]|nr:lytic transglycosylase domain-containing protein [Candidatus Eremiobacteraeota bacterium]
GNTGEIFSPSNQNFSFPNYQGGSMNNPLSMNSPVSELKARAEEIANEFGIPSNLFDSLITQESSWNPQAGSVTGAFGLTQLEPQTAESVGVGSSIYTSPDNQLFGGAKYLSGLYQQYGSWVSALRAYFGGSAAVNDPSISDGTITAGEYANEILARAGMGSQG